MIRQAGIGNRVGLATKLRLSRARITQGMAVLGAPVRVLDAIPWRPRHNDLKRLCARPSWPPTTSLELLAASTRA